MRQWRFGFLVFFGNGYKTANGHNREQEVEYSHKNVFANRTSTFGFSPVQVQYHSNDENEIGED
mgnify:CR=1 FL=1